MARKSKVDRLPPEIRSEIEDLRDAGRTIDEILAKLRELGVGEDDVSRPGLGRWTKKWDAMRERLQTSGMAADVLISRLEAEGTSKRIAQLNVSMMQAQVMEFLAGGEDGEPVTFDTDKAKTLSEIIRNLANAAKSEQDRLVVYRKESEREKQALLAEAARVAEKDAIDAGISGERAAELRRKLLGVRQPPPAA